MPGSTFVSLRDQTTGRINDLLIDEYRACAQTQNLLAFLAGSLLNYRDEGVEFTPSIILCDDLQTFLRSFPGSVAHTIGTAVLDPSSGPKILKDCGPLSNNSWFIFIERFDDKQLKYGIFTYFRLPTTIPLQEGINIDANCFSILLRKTNQSTVEISGAKGNSLTLSFSTIRESANYSSVMKDFSRNCCCGIENIKQRQEFFNYLSRLLESALTASHGTILICIANLDLTALPELHDAVAISPMLDFYAAFSEFQAANTAGSILTLQRCEELLQGFLRSDGMIVFDTVGRVTAYRVFFQPIGDQAIPENIVGGARRRAFEGVKDLVNDNVVSVLFRSQDGLTLYHGAAA